MIIKHFCSVIILILFLGLITGSVLSAVLRHRKRERIKLMALMGGPPLCKICEDELARYSVSSDPKLQQQYCYECMISVETSHRYVVGAAEVYEDMARVFADLGQVFSRPGFSAQRKIVKSKYKHNRKKKSSRRA